MGAPEDGRVIPVTAPAPRAWVSIVVPTLVAAPDDDRLIPVAHAHRYAELIPGATFASVADCGHAMYFEKPAEFADLVTRFAGQRSASGRPLSESGSDGVTR